MTQSQLQRATQVLAFSTVALCAAQPLCFADPLDKVGFHLASEGTNRAGQPATAPISNQISGKQQLIRTADSFLTATLITYGLKSIIHEDRPDDSGDDSFPSAHTSAAFAVATTQAHFHPKQAPYWYGAATLVGIQRVADDKHYWHDVAAGAALGYFTARLELRQKKGLILRPFIDGSGGTSRTTGLTVSRTF